jgi:hypothetical protein
MSRVDAGAGILFRAPAGRTKENYKEMTSRKFKSALRLLATVFLTFVTAVVIVEILAHL